MNSGPPVSPQSAAEKFRLGSHRREIFIIHPSSVLTDHQAHGDGLLTYRYICELAQRGYGVTVACENVRLQNPPPPNVTIYPIALRFEKAGLFKRLEYAWKVRRLFVRLNRTRRFDIAHQLNPVFAGLSLGLVGLRVPIVLGPYVAHWSHRRASRSKRIVLDAISRVQQRFADAVLLSGPAARGRIVSKHVDAGDIFTVPYGIDLTAFPHEPLPSGNPIILYLASLSAYKGILVLLEAFDAVAARCPTARLVVAGDGPYRERARAAAAASRFGERISFIGTVDRGRVPALLAGSTVYCLTSYGEPYGMSLVEAMAAGRPVVATNVGGPADLVDDRGGFLVPPGDPAALADALATIVGDPQTARAMGEYNRAAMSAYTWSNVIDRLERVYDVVIARRARTGAVPVEVGATLD